MLFKLISKAPVVFILGSTASGKSDWAYRCAKEFSCDIISADAYQVYREMSIGTAKPSENWRKEVKHHLMDCVSVTETFDVARFVNKAHFLVKEAVDSDRKIIITGGTNYYVYTLLNGLYDVPKSQKSYALSLSELTEKTDSETVLWEKVLSIDPMSAYRIHRHDRRRLLRVLDVFEQTGRPISSFKKRGALKDLVFHQKIGLRFPDEHLLKRIEDRIEQMLSMGFLTEVESLIEKNLSQTHAFQTALGYKEAQNVLEGKMSLDEFRLFLFTQTKKIVKKQLKWLKRDKDIHWLDGTVS